ncbi:MAG: co-chaperone GroES [Firmicutes bacterium]|nr:co-chaperone GroES [Bacillota bacterium]
MAAPIRPLGGRVLLKLLEEESMTSSGLVIPDTAKEKPQQGEVVALGDDEDIKVKVGDKVLFPKYLGTETRLDSTDYLIIDAGELLGVF